MSTSLPLRRLTEAETTSVTGDKLVSNLNEAVRRLTSNDERNVADVRSTLQLLAGRLQQLHAAQRADADRYPSVEQFAALRRRMVDQPRQVTLHHRAFDLPDGYLLCVEGDGFTYGIAPDGAISS
jgi:uncharacterized coiled-coil protein SlyX